MNLKKLIELEQRKLKSFFKVDSQEDLDKYDELYIDVANKNLITFPKNEQFREYMTLKETNLQYSIYRARNKSNKYEK
jgi:hypothetical protein